MRPTPAGSAFGLGCDKRGAGGDEPAQQSRSHATRTIVSETAICGSSATARTSVSEPAPRAMAPTVRSIRRAVSACAS